MSKPKLGDRIEQWFVSLPLVGGIAQWVMDWQERRKAQRQALTEAIEGAIAEGDWGQVVALVVTGSLSQLLGDVPFLGDTFIRWQGGAISETEQFKQDPQGYLESKIEAAFSDPATRAFTEFVGTIITDPVVTLFETYAADPDPDPHAFARSFHGIASGLPWAAGALDSVLSLILGRRAPQPGKHVMALYWGLGLGFLGWQTLAPLLSSGLQPNLARHYLRLYRPSRFSPSQVSDLFALGERSATEVREYLRDQGWRDEDINLWIKLSYRTLSEGVLWDLYETGELSKSEMDQRLRVLGYDPDDLPLLYRSHEPEEKEESKRFLISTVKSAFRDGRMSEAEFRQILTEQNYDPQVIDLLVVELTLAREEQEKILSEGNIKLLYNQRVIGRDEAIHYLTEVPYPPDIAANLVEAWDRAAMPKAARINRSTILEGFTDGVLSRGEALGLLKTETGLDDQQAELVLKIEEAGRPEPVEQAGVAAASLTMLSNWVIAGLITRAELEDRAELDRYAEEDKERIVALMFAVEPEALAAIDLPIPLLEEAYVFGVIDRQDLTDRLTARGIADEDVEIQIRTLELAFPDVFGERPLVLMRHPSVASMQLALQRGLISEAEFGDKLTAQGYTQDAVDIFTFNAQYQLPAEPRKPPTGTLVSWLREGIIGRQEFIRRMTEAGYLSTDVDLYLAAESPAIEDTFAADLLVQGYIDQTGFTTLATEMGYTPQEIEEFLTLYLAGEYG